MEQYTVTGMSCAACQARVEKAVNSVPGVNACSVSLLTNSMGVEGDASPAEVIRAVEQAGYGASLKGATKAGHENAFAAEEEALRDHETPKLKKRLIASLGFLLALMYLTMGHHMLHLPLPGALAQNYLGMTLIQLLLAASVMIINYRFFTSGFTSLMHGSPNMDTLVSLGSAVSFGWSTWVFFEMTAMVTKGADMSQVMHLYHNELYYESAAMIPALITVGKMLEAMSKGRTTDALKGLMKLAPETATVERDGKEEEISAADVVIGDIFLVRPGESIPVDGIILEGETSVNEAALTGESIPVDKTKGDPVSAATINTSGFIRCQATRVGEDTTLSRIIQMVSDAAATKAPIARIADRVSGVFVPAVITIAALTTAGWLIHGETLAFALARGISVLVISCPCALGLATPVAIMVGNGIGARNGILFKTSESLETAGKVQIIALDKTGTITEGTPKVTDVIAEEGKEDRLLGYAYALETGSEHPLASAVVEYAKEKGIPLKSVSSVQALAGNGLTGTVEGTRVFGGNEAFISSKTVISPDFRKAAERLSAEGKTPMYFADDAQLLGIIAVADVIRADSEEAIRQLQKMGIEVVMLTGDNRRTADAIGKQAGVDSVIADVLPDGKEEVVRNLKQRGITAMAGDGINDAPALTRADIGIAIGAGTDVAIDSADIVLMNSRLLDVAAAVRLSRATLRNIHENLFWAFFYNLICIPLAAGLFAWKMNPMIGAAAMSLSSFTVCMNALRLNLFRIHDSSSDRPGRRALPAKETEASSEQEAEDREAGMKEEPETGRTLELLIEGMMCSHCEARVKKALESLSGVISADADHTAGIVRVTVTEAFDPDTAKRAIGEAGYTLCEERKEKGKQQMKKVINVEGMMCSHCEAAVKKALEAIDGVESAAADHEKNTAEVVLSKPVADEVLKAAVEAKDYTVTGITAE